VRVAATTAALRFVTKLAFEAQTHEPVIGTLWPTAGGPRTVPHIDLARWADVVLVYPATATTLSRIARGDCSNIVSATAIATRSPVIVVPGMNRAMYEAPSTQRNVRQLKRDGFFVAHPAFGYEVADAPNDRVPVFGPPPPVHAVVEIIEAVLGAAPTVPSRRG
jgi:phosphopantothenoylcysteine decarboxylase/phosphopantothenate--cysteine ligase